ncbi:MAG: TrpR like protein, YerC/YecD [Robiginitomaculum sp.]|nr:MAG: TrpR like protein, YerC/YecD [Robiginitomaculum sp.]
MPTVSKSNALAHRKDLASALRASQSVEEVENFLVDLCTPAEVRALSERWHVAKLLDKGELSYRDIHAQTGVSTTTIGRVARFLNEEPHQGYRTILDRQKNT